MSSDNVVNNSSTTEIQADTEENNADGGKGQIFSIADKQRSALYKSNISEIDISFMLMSFQKVTTLFKLGQKTIQAMAQAYVMAQVL